MTRRAIGFLLAALVILAFGIASTATIAYTETAQPHETVSPDHRAPDLTSRYDNDRPRLP